MQRSKVPEDFLSLAGACWQERTFPMQKFYRLSVNIVKILTLLLAVFLFIGSFLTTCYAAPSEGGVVLNLGAFPNAARTYFLRMGKGKQAGCCLFSLWRFGPYGFLILESLKQKRNSVCPNSNGSFHAASLFSSRALSFAVCERPENYVLTFAVRISRDI